MVSFDFNDKLSYRLTNLNKKGKDMSRRNITDTAISSEINILMYLDPCIRFMIEHGSDVVLNDKDVSKIVSDSLRVSNTLNSNIYAKFINDSKVLDSLTCVYLKDISKIPYILTTPWFIFDVPVLASLDIKGIVGISSIEDYRNKIILDITQYIKKSPNSPIRLTDILAFQSIIIKAVINRSYYNFEDIWLTSFILFYLAKIYGSVLSSKIARLYNLNIQEQLTITVLFMTYMINKCSSDKQPSDMLLSRDSAIKKTIDLPGLIELLLGKCKNNDLTINHVIEAIRESGPNRMSDFSYKILVHLCLSLTNDHLISLTAIEYPPYFLSILLDAISGIKTALYHDIKNAGLRKDAQILGTEILRSKNIFKIDHG
jgi:hypothetical protein